MGNDESLEKFHQAESLECTPLLGLWADAGLGTLLRVAFSKFCVCVRALHVCMHACLESRLTISLEGEGRQ